jgi:hypothetical protein
MCCVHSQKAWTIRTLDFLTKERGGEDKEQMEAASQSNVHAFLNSCFLQDCQQGCVCETKRGKHNQLTDKEVTDLPALLVYCIFMYTWTNAGPPSPIYVVAWTKIFDKKRIFYKFNGLIWQATWPMCALIFFHLKVMFAQISSYSFLFAEKTWFS